MLAETLRGILLRIYQEARECSMGVESDGGIQIHTKNPSLVGTFAKSVQNSLQYEEWRAHPWQVGCGSTTVWSCLEIPRSKATPNRKAAELPEWAKPLIPAPYGEEHQLAALCASHNLDRSCLVRNRCRERLNPGLIVGELQSETTSPNPGGGRR